MSSRFKRVPIWDREKKSMAEEKLLTETSLRFLYEGRLGRFLTSLLFARRVFSRYYGWWSAERAWSRRNIQRFAGFFEIPLEDFEEGPFKNFNEFFIREFKPGKRTFVTDPDVMPSSAEGRFLGWNRFGKDDTFPVKGEFLTAAALLADRARGAAFEGGPVLLMRLAPQDYHRFHFADDGEIVEQYSIPGPLHSVNPIAVFSRGDIFCTNHRIVTIQQTVNFGTLAYVDVGALAVGRIVEKHSVGYRANRGEVRGYFKLGGSSIVVLGEPGKWEVDSEILEYTQKKIETMVKLGTPVAHRK